MPHTLHAPSLKPGLSPLCYTVVVVLVTQSCPTLCDPTDCSPPGSSVHGDSPGKNTGVGCHSLLQGICPTQGSSLHLLWCRWILYHWASWEPGMAGRVLTCLPGVLGSVQLQDLLQGLFVVLPLIFSFFHNLESDLTCQRGSENHQKE